MLLNASHELTNSGLPEDIQIRYVRYKQGNRAIVAWMTKYGPEKFKGRKTLPIKQLIALGTSLCERIDEIGVLPADVDFYFEEVIKERAYLSQHFRDFRDCCEKDHIDTVNHEHFTNSLKEIHKILLTAGKPAARTKVAVRNPPKGRVSSTSSIKKPTNSFAHLSLSKHDGSDSDDSDDEALSDADTNATSECSDSIIECNVSPCDSDKNDTDFLDCGGSLGAVAETTIFLKEVLRIADVIKSCWLKAGNGGLPLGAAAAYTNILLAKVIATTKSFCQLGDESWQPNCSRTVSRGMVSLDNPGAEPTANGVHELAKALCNMFDKVHLQSSRTTVDIVQTTPSIIEHTTDPGSLCNSLISSLQHAYDCKNVSSITFDGIPCTAELFPRHKNHDKASSTTLSSVIVYMISVSHCAYSSTLAQPSQIAMPRIKALRLANEAAGVIKGFIDDKCIFPCQCTNTLAYRVAQMQRALEAFAKHKCWNVISQSPLVAGNHLLEIHDLCSYYGMYLFHYRQFVAAVLHTYQALIELNAMETIPILEAVCDLFATVLYTTGTRPESGFMASWRRYIGARLKFNKGKKHLNHRDTWCMSIPAHAAATSAGLNISQRNRDIKIQPKFDYGTIDQVIKLKRDGWVLADDFPDPLDNELQIVQSGIVDQQLSAKCEQPLHTQKTSRGKHTRTKSCCISKDSTQKECSRLHHTLAASFAGDALQDQTLSPSRFNLLSFFHSMTEVVSGISDYTHIEDDKNSDTKNNGKGQMCLCFVQTILQASDRILDVRKRVRIDACGSTWSKNEKECIECYKRCLMKMLEEAKVPDRDGDAWLWSSM